MSNSSERPTVQLSDLLLCLRALDAGMWHYDIDADQLWCDDRWHAMLGLAPGSVRHLSDFRRFVHPADEGTATRINLGEVADMIARDRPYHVDFRVIRTDGVVRCWRSVACLIINEANGHRRAVGCVTDITVAQELAMAPVGDGLTPIRRDDDQPRQENQVDAPWANRSASAK